MAKGVQMFRLITISTALALASSTASLPALAPDDESSPLANAPAFGTAVAPSGAAENLTAGSHSLPSDSKDLIEVTDSDGRTMTVELAFDDSYYQHQSNSANAAQYSDSETGSEMVIQANDDGQLRVITTVPNADSPTEFSYKIDSDFTVSEDGNGGLLAYRFTDQSTEEGHEVVDMVAIQPPWATDAAGNEVATRYEVDGNTITQIVEVTEGTQFPVSADPTWEWYDAAYGAGWNKAETRSLHQHRTTSALCRVLPGALRSVCSVGAISWKLNTQYAVDRGGCVFYAIAPVPVGLNYDKSKNCR